MNQVQNGGVEVLPLGLAGGVSVRACGRGNWGSDVFAARSRKKTTKIAFMPKPQLPPGPTVN